MSVVNRGKGKNKRWHYAFMIDGERYHGAIPLEEARTKSEAEDFERKKRLEVRSGQYGRQPGTEDFGKFVEEVYMPYSKKYKASWKHDEFRCEVLKQQFAGKSFREIKAMDIEMFVHERLASTTQRVDGTTREHKKRSPTTVRKELALLSSIFNKAIANDVADSNPCLKVSPQVLKLIPLRNKRERVLSRDEEQKLLAQLTGPREHIRPLVILAINTGIRKGGLLGIKQADVNLGETARYCSFDLRGQTMEVMVKPNHVLVRNKGGKPYTVPLNQIARAVFAKLAAEENGSNYLFANERTGRGLTDFKRAYTGACREAGIRNLTFHDLRHTFATRLKEVGEAPETRRDLLGHSTVEMSADYTHSSTEFLQRAVEKIADQRTQDYNTFTTTDVEADESPLVH